MQINYEYIFQIAENKMFIFVYNYYKMKKNTSR